MRHKKHILKITLTILKQHYSRITLLQTLEPILITLTAKVLSIFLLLMKLLEILTAID